MAAHPARAGSSPRQGLTAGEYQSLCEYLESTCGLVLGEGKEYLLRSRLAPLLSELGIDGYSQLLHRVQAGDRRLRERVLDAMTTNETFWFREPVGLETVLSLMTETPAGRGFRVLSAGCSSGQEAYSLSIAYDELARNSTGLPALSILGVDVSAAAVGQASQAVYSAMDMQRGLDDRRRARYFRPADGGWSLIPDIRRRAEFRVHNLLDPLSGLGRFNVVLCRNVLIYFSQQRRQAILSALAATLLPGGALLLGPAETMPRGLAGLQRVERARQIFYRRPGH